MSYLVPFGDTTTEVRDQRNVVKSAEEIDYLARRAQERAAEQAAAAARVDAFKQAFFAAPAAAPAASASSPAAPGVRAPEGGLFSNRTLLLLAGVAGIGAFVFFMRRRS